MFEKIIVDTQHLPLRNAASKGNLEAMCQLARHLLDGDRTIISAEIVEELCLQIVDHQELKGNILRMKDLCGLQADCSFLFYQEKKITLEECRKRMRTCLKNFIYWSTEMPMEEWDIAELKSCIDWLYEQEEPPIETMN